jgi:uncharacterized radical SAM superfamily Fe-S cluster-containing enzyme
MSISSSETYFKTTKSTCPTCRKIIDADVYFRNNQVFFKKHCKDHGASEAMVSEDAEYYARAYGFTRPGSIPHGFSEHELDGCPKDCGLCAAHEQHTCLPIIEITDKCNLECPICIVQNNHRYFMPMGDFQRIIQNLLAKEGEVDVVNFSGGEPTIHPQFIEMVRYCETQNIKRLSVVTNGIRIAEDRAFAEEIAKTRLYVNLQMEGFNEKTHENIRGSKELLNIHLKCLDVLAELKVPTTIVATMVAGVNDDQLGLLVKYLLEHDHVLNLNVQPAAFTGYGGSNYKHDPLNILTIPGVMRRIEEQTGGAIKKTDFTPLPCSHPHCFSLTYLLRMDDGSFMPLPRFLDAEKYLTFLENTATIDPSDKLREVMEDTINVLWSAGGLIPHGEQVTRAIKRAIKEMYPCCPVSREEALRAAERQVKTIFIHHFMDEHTLDVERLMKCCNHYPLPDGRLMPGCSYNLFYRHRPDYNPALKGQQSPSPDHQKKLPMLKRV